MNRQMSVWHEEGEGFGASARLNSRILDRLFIPLASFGRVACILRRRFRYTTVERNSLAHPGGPPTEGYESNTNNDKH